MTSQAHPEKAGGHAAPKPNNLRAFGLNLALLGPLSLTDEQGCEITVASKKNRLLLAMLALAPESSISRDLLAGTLWRDHSEEQARNSLRQVLAVLRRELSGREMQMFSSFDTTLTLSPKVVTIDVEQFARDATAADAESLRQALRLWRGPFLADVAIEDETLDQWLMVRREHFHNLHIRALDNLVPLASGHEQIVLAQQLIALDTLREASHRRLIEAYQARGERAQALRHYEKLRKLLKDEMAVEPSVESQALRAAVVAASSGNRNGAGPPGLPAITAAPFTTHPELTRHGGN